MLIGALATLGASPRKPISPEPTAILPAEPVWTLMLETPPSAGGAIDAHRVYVPVDEGGVRAFARETGALVWSDPASTRMPLLAAGGRLFTVPGAEVRALAPDTGELLWRREIDDGIAAPPIHDDGRLIVPTGAGDVLALADADGGVLWRRTLGARSRHPASPLPPSRVVLVLDDGRVVALAGATGEIAWERPLPGTLSAPATARDRVLVGSTDNFFYALDAQSGDEVWRWRTGGDVIGAAAQDDRVYFASLDNVLRAVNRGNGNQIWKAAMPTRPSRPPIAFGDVVVVTGVSPRLDAFLGRTGAPLGSYTAPGDLQDAPLIDTAPDPFEVAVVVLMRDGRMTGLRPTRLAFPDPPLVPLLKLPGRELPAERPGW